MAFLPTDLDAAEWRSVEPLVRALAERPVDSAPDYERWLLDRSDLDAACSEARANLYIAMTCRTDDEQAAGAWTRYLEEALPPLQKASFELDRRQVELAAAHPIDAGRYAVLDRDTLVDVELFRDENVPLETKIARLDQDYDRICAAQTVRFQGEERTMPQLARFLEEEDRATRETAWRLGQERRLEDAGPIEDIFDGMIQLRDEVARNASFDNYRDFAFRRRRRFDYTPADCATFHDAIAEHVVPLVRRLDGERAGAMGLDPLRPWDLSVDVQGRPPLRPFEGAEDLVQRCARMFRRMDADLGRLFDDLATGDDLDLESRRGKAPGGYQYVRDLSRRPFIFMNAAGMHHDVQTMVHEAGHAFHSLLCRDEPIVHYRHSPIEFAEVASMAMELLSMDYWDEFYPDPGDLRRAQREQFEGVVSVLPWVATIDAFQHWLYTNPGHARTERTAFWESLMTRFGRAVDWTGLERFRAGQWRRQGHLFGSPFYYIEYAIAQLGALQLWGVARRDGLDAALAGYKRALALGGSRPLPELFEAAGATLDFTAPTVERLMGEVSSALAELPG
jgi:oligoendopeptidase F